MDPKQIKLGFKEKLPEMKEYSTKNVQSGQFNMQFQRPVEEDGMMLKTSGFDVSHVRLHGSGTCLQS